MTRTHEKEAAIVCAQELLKAKAEIKRILPVYRAAMQFAEVCKDSIIERRGRIGTLLRACERAEKGKNLKEKHHGC